MVDVSKEKFEGYLTENQDRLGSVIHDLWNAKDGELWARDPYFYIRLGTLADQVGQVMFAQDVLEEGLQYFPGNPQLIQLYSLSSIKCGFLLKARDMLIGLVKKGHQDEETLGKLGRVYKEMWLIADRTNSGHPFLVRSRNLYLKAFTKSQGYYSGINAASLSMLAGDRDSAGKLALQVLNICHEEERETDSPDHWLLAAAGEAYTLLGRREESLVYYERAWKSAGRRFADLASMRRQLNLLSTVSSIAGELLNDLRIPPVVAFTGHMLDRPHFTTSRFPSAMADEVGRQVAKALDELEGDIGYASAASGSDVLFLEAMQERGGETNVILPFDREDFFEVSVEFAGPDWRERVERALDRSTRVEQVTQGKYDGDDVLFAYANEIIMGRAILRSRFLETEPILLTVWDGNRTKDVGGTAEFVHNWQKRGYAVKVVDLRRISQPAITVGNNRQRHSAANRKKPRAPAVRENVAMLFADLVGFSRLSEEQIPYFVSGLLGKIARRVSKLPRRPIYKNIWGDALYFVFDDYTAAAECGLALRDLMREVDWTKQGLPAGLALRIGLHAGPVYRCREPLLNRDNYFGYHVNQAARIEPITAPGNVYASEQFAALLTGVRADKLDCRYVGVIMLPKEFGSYPIYHIKRKREIE